MDGGNSERAASLESVTRVFESNTVVLDSFGYTFPGCKVTGIVGPSGCGKSTMLRIIAGLDTDYKRGGVVSTLGESADTSFNEGHVALLSSQNALLPWRTAIENVRLPRDLRGWAKKESTEKARELLNDAHLDQQANKYPHQLSDGQRQRLRLAQSLATDPQLLLLDEPFNAIDLGLRAALVDEVRQYIDSPGKKRSAIIVAHSLEEIIALADEVIVVSGDPSGKGADKGRQPKPMRVEGEKFHITFDRQARADETESAIQNDLAEIRDQIVIALKQVANVPKVMAPA